jgi:nucleotide-binding universal stress UspA family protein
MEAYRKDMGEIAKCHCQVWEGTVPYLGIMNYALEKDVDLIVMGSHSSASRGKWCIGSTVHEVSARADCPVAVVTHPQDVMKIDQNQTEESYERGQDEHRQHSERA